MFGLGAGWHIPTLVHIKSVTLLILNHALGATDSPDGLSCTLPLRHDSADNLL